MMSRTVFALAVPMSFSGNGGTFGGGAFGGVPRMYSRMNEPRSTGDVRFGYAAAIRIAPLPSRPQRVESVSSTRWKRSPLTFFTPYSSARRSFRYVYFAVMKSVTGRFSSKMLFENSV